MRWLIRIFFSLVLLVALLVGALFLLPADKIAALASEQLRKATGREVTLSGRLKPSIWPQIGVATGPVTLSNAEWASDTPMVQAEGLSIGLDLKALIAGDIKVRNVEVLSPRILLERAKDGRANWQFGSAEVAQTSAAPAPAKTGTTTSGFTLDRAVISGGSVIFVDGMAGGTQTIADLDASLTLPDYNGPADLALSASVNGQPIQAKLTLGAFSAFIAGQVGPVVADISAGASRIQFNGRAGTAPMAAIGTLDADASDLAALFKLTGAPSPDLPAGVSGKIALAGQVTYAPEGSAHLREGKITVGGNVLSGAADLYLAGAKPKLNAQLSTGALNLAPFLGGSSTGRGGAGDGGGGNTAATSGWSKDPIDVSALGTLDAEVALSAESIDLGTAKLGKTRLLATLTDRRLVLDLREVRGYDGLVTGNVVVNGRGGLSMGGDLNAAGIGMLALLTDLADYKRLSTSADFSLKFLASGNSMDALMHSLSGSGAFALGQGELLGVDLARTFLRPAEGADVNSDARTIFNSVAATYSIAGGVLSNTDLAMLSPRITLAGRGNVGIGAQTLDYNITPTAFAGEDGTGGVKVPLKIAGTWAKPKFSLDFDELAKQRTEAQRKELEDKVRSNVERELGVTEGSDESLEDAAKRKLREEAARGLKNLLKK